MREHKFRARDIATGKWYIGSTNPAKGEINLPTFFSNIHVGAFDVNTLGEFTGLHDKNGKEIWEGDIVKEDEFIGDIRYINGSVCVWFKNVPEDWCHEYYPVFSGSRHLEVIGDIYSNPELLEK